MHVLWKTHTGTLIDKCTIHKQCNNISQLNTLIMDKNVSNTGMSVRFRQYQRLQASHHTQNPSGSSLHTKPHFGYMVLSSSSPESDIVSFATIWCNSGSETHFPTACFLFVFSFCRLSFSSFSLSLISSCFRKTAWPSWFLLQLFFSFLSLVPLVLHYLWGKLFY